MEEQRWRQLGAASGAGAVILLIVGSFVVPKMPKVSDRAVKVQSYFLAHRNSLRVSVYLIGVAGALFVWFLGSVRSHLRRAEGGDGRLSAVAFGAGLVFLGSAAAGAMVEAALLIVARQADPSTVRAFYDVLAVMASLLAFPFIPFAGAIAVVGLRHRALPSWLSYGFALFALYEFVEGAAFVSVHGAFSPGGVLNQIGLVAFAVLVLALSLVLVQAAAQPARPEAVGTGAPG